MAKTITPIEFEAPLLQPTTASKADGAWLFLKLPQEASDPLPSRGQVAVEGTLNGVPILLVLQPDGEGGHWMKVDSTLQKAAGLSGGERAHLVVSPTRQWPEPEVPGDLLEALERHPEALAVWHAINAAARTDWIYWLSTAKKEETRVKRIDAACDMLSKGKRRVCCFDRSGIVGKGITCPIAEEAE